MSSQQPSRNSYDSSEKFDAEETLLGGTRRHEELHRRGNWLKLGLGAWAVLATVVAAALAGSLYASQDGPEAFPPKGKRSVVFMVSDGMGPASLALTRNYLQHVEHLPWDKQLFLDKKLIGTSRTRSSSSLVTDSAAGATAFGCALKSYNGAVGVDPDGQPCGTVLEAAKLAGYKTGLVVTTRMTDATPACFSAHVHLRSEEDRIAEQQLGDYPLGRVVDLMLGGGRCHFLPNSTGFDSCRADDRDLVKEAQEKHGFQYVSDRAGFDSLKKGAKAKLPLLGLFARTDIPYDIDRDPKEFPSLDEMAEMALNILQRETKDSDKGFFLMVEGSRIDHAGHGNDPAAQVREVLAYDKTFERVHKWVEENDAVLVATSDHETGGLALSRQLHDTYPEYLWYPEVLKNASNSGEYLAYAYMSFEGTPEDEELFVREILVKDRLGITDANDPEIEAIMANKYGRADYVFADMISRRAQIGWSTHGHSGVDVNIYGSKGTERLMGNHENTEVGAFLADFLDLDLSRVTHKLRRDGVDRSSWMGKSLEELWAEAEAEEDYDREAHHNHDTQGLDSYHGDFRKRSLGGVADCGCKH